MKKTLKKSQRAVEVPQEIEILDEGEDLEGLYSTFGVSDRADVEGILSGSVGEAEW